MKYAPRFYARAFAECIYGEGIESVHDKMTSAEKDALVANLVASIRRHGDAGKFSIIIKETARMLRKKTGAREVLIETARPLEKNPVRLFKSFLKPHDAVETRIAPELVAGVKITIDGEREFDMTLSRKLTKLFASSNY